MRIALYGGSFDPPHVVHQMVCLYVLSTQPVDKVWMIPCFQHPFGKQSVSFLHRFQMCQLATEMLHPYVSVSNIEEQLGGVSYTLCTVKELQRRYPEDEFAVIIGEDVLSSQTKWYGFEELKRLVSFIVVGREGSQSAMSLPLKLPELSSTTIRERLAQGIRPTGLAPKEVIEYIEKYQLYQGK